MDPATLALLTHTAQAAKAITSATVSAPVRRITLNRRVAFTAARQAKRSGIRIRYRHLYAWLTSEASRAQFATHTPESMDDAAHALASVVSGDTSAQREANALTVLRLTLINLLAKMDPSAAVAQSHQWLSASMAHAADQARSTVQTVGAQVLQRLDTRDTFDSGLAFLPQWRREPAVQLRAVWPAIETAVAQLSTASDKAALLGQWTEHPPSWLESPPAGAWAWLGLTASDYGAYTHAATLIDRAVQAGIFPRGYYVARAAMLLSEPDPGPGLDYLRAHPDDDPFWKAIDHLLLGHTAEAREQIQAWQTQGDEQAAIRGMTLARTIEQDNPNGAIAEALDVWKKFNAAAGAAITAARLLLARAANGGSASKAADTQQAMDLAIGARNSRRAWGGDSAEAVDIAVAAAHLAHDPDRAWSLTQAEPDGEASASEADDPRVQAHAALTAALTGNTERARQLVDTIDEPFHRAEVTAVIAERSDDMAVALEAWTAAWQAASSDGQRLQAASGIASNGGTLPDLNDLGTRHPEAVTEIRLVAQVLAADDPLTALKANVHRSRRILIELVKRYADNGQDREAAEALEDGARRWGEPELWAMAARSYRHADLLPQARAIAERALAVGGAAWVDRRRVLALLMEVEASSENWAAAAAAARQLIEADPDDIDAQWALVRCQLAGAERDAAWASLTTRGNPLQPRDRTDALVWLQLNARYSTDPRFLGNALALMRAWPDDPDLLGTFLVLAYTGVRREELEPSEQDLAELHRVTADYTQRYPDSTVFRSQAMGPEGDPLLPFAPDLQRQYEQSRDVTEEVTSGRMPLPTLGTVVGRSWTEASLKRAAGVVYAADLPVGEHEVAAVLAAVHTPAVIDPTMAHTVTLLDPALREKLIGHPASLLTTDSLFKDALQARDSLILRSTLSVGWDPDRQQAVPVETSQANADLLADRARALVEVIGGAARHPHPQLLHFPNDPDRRMAWLSGIDLAKEQGWIYWSDDRIMRQLAHSMGVATFSTLTLLEHLATTGTIEPDHLDVAHAELIRNYYVDLEFNPAALEFAATAEQWHATGAALALSRPTAWSPPEAAAEFVLTAIGHVVAASPEDVSGWAHAASTALIEIAGDTESAATNLEVLLRRSSTQHWFGPAVLPFLLIGIRAAINRSHRTEIRDPLPPPAHRPAPPTSPPGRPRHGRRTHHETGQHHRRRRSRPRREDNPDRRLLASRQRLIGHPDTAVRVRSHSLSIRIIRSARCHPLPRHRPCPSLADQSRRVHP